MMKNDSASLKLIETDNFSFEFLSRLAERESWRKEVHRPIYHLHKWWAKRLGSVFRGILLGSALPIEANLEFEYYRPHLFRGFSVFDPFMGAGTTIGEAHKLGFTALGRDINPVAAEAVRVSLGKMQKEMIQEAFVELSGGVGEKIRALYQTKDSKGRTGEVLYYFWVMQLPCIECEMENDLFDSWIISQHAYPEKRAEIQILCPHCGEIFKGAYRNYEVCCPKCQTEFNSAKGSCSGGKVTCLSCGKQYAPIDSAARLSTKPKYRLYGKLVLAENGNKEYLKATQNDLDSYAMCIKRLIVEEENGNIRLPHANLLPGHNTKQAINYGFKQWRDFFNSRQLIALGWLQSAIMKIENCETRDTFLLLFSTILEFNNMFASFKGEGTGAVRPMFAHHILKPERTPIEANIWGTSKSSGSFLNLYRSKIFRAIQYKLHPFEILDHENGRKISVSIPFTSTIDKRWPSKGDFENEAIYLSCGDSSKVNLIEKSIDLIITDPPFFNNVHYSELADFFYAWQQLAIRPEHFTNGRHSTRAKNEVQDVDARGFTQKLASVFKECHRLLKDSGLMVFTYHHSRAEGWRALAEAILRSDFVVVNSHPVKSELSVAIPKSNAKEPIQLDIMVICRKKSEGPLKIVDSYYKVAEISKSKIHRLQNQGMRLSANDYKVIFFGQSLAMISSIEQIDSVLVNTGKELDSWLALKSSEPEVPIENQKLQTIGIQGNLQLTRNP